MKKLLSYLAITSLAITSSSNVTSCFLFPNRNKGSSYQDVYDKINDKTTGLDWTDNTIDNGSGKTDLTKTGEDKPASWISMLDGVFGLSTSDTDEMKYVIDIKDKNDNLLANGTAEDVVITLSKNPTSVKPITQEITKTITWSNGDIPDTELVQNTIDAINDAEYVKALGATLSTDASDSETTASILNDIGLDQDEKDIVTISGTLNEDTTANLTFTVKKNAAEDSVVKDVYFYENSYANNSQYIYDVCEYNGVYYDANSSTNKVNVLNDDTFAESSTNVLSGPETNYFYISNNILYAATNSGLYELTSTNSSFTNVDASFTRNSYIAYDFENEIYIGTSNGLYKIDGSTINKIGSSSVTIYGLETYNNQLYIASTSGLYKLNSSGDDIENVGSNTDAEHSLASYNGKLYIGTDNGLYKLNSSGDDIEAVDNTVSSIYTVLVYNNHLYAGGHSSHGLYELDSSGTSLTQILSRSDETAISLVNNTLFMHGSYISDQSTDGIEFYYSTT